jgi:hypothetical protein
MWPVAATVLLSALSKRAQVRGSVGRRGLTEAQGVEFSEVLQTQLEEQGMIPGPEISEMPSPAATSAEHGTIHGVGISLYSTEDDDDFVPSMPL